MADVSALPVRPGQSMDFDTYLVNNTGHRVQVTGASLAYQPGKPKARLLHVGLENSKNTVGVQLGWPPDGVHATPLIGAWLPPGRNYIAVGITGTHVGTVYPVAGVTLTVSDGGLQGEATAWGGGMACVYQTAQQRQHCIKGPDTDQNLIQALQDYIHSH